MAEYAFQLITIMETDDELTGTVFGSPDFYCRAEALAQVILQATYIRIILV